MRVRNVVLLLITIMVAVLLPTSSVSAFEGETVIRGHAPYISFPWCTVPGEPPGDTAVVVPPKAPFTGTAALRITTPTQCQFWLYVKSHPLISSLVGKLRVSTSVGDGTAPFMGVDIVTPDPGSPDPIGNDGDYDRLTAVVPLPTSAALLPGMSPSASEWSHTDLSALKFDWHHHPDGSKVTDFYGSGTLSEYDASHPGRQASRVTLYLGSTSDVVQAPAAVTYIDDVNLDGGPTYDIERSLPVATMSAPRSVPYAHAIPVRGTLTRDGSAMAGKRVELWERTYPASTYVKSLTVTSSSTGTLYAVRRPNVRTYYQWRLPASDGDPPVTSAVASTGVSTLLSAHVLDSTLTRSQPVVVYGRTTPVKSGVLVRLFRAGTSTVYAAGRTASDGTYALSSTLPRGTFDLIAVVEAATGNDTGRSKPVRVTVN